jgi:hypothetical protein
MSSKKYRYSSLLNFRIFSNSRKNFVKNYFSYCTLIVYKSLQTLHGHQKKIYETGECCQHHRGELFFLLSYV